MKNISQIHYHYLLSRGRSENLRSNISLFPDFDLSFRSVMLSSLKALRNLHFDLGIIYSQTLIFVVCRMICREHLQPRFKKPPSGTTQGLKKLPPLDLPISRPFLPILKYNK